MKALYKSTIIIWSDFDPMTVELSQLASEAESGSALCTSFDGSLIEDPSKDDDWDDIDFFDEDEEELS